jgi:hypothetical protein
MKEIVSASGQDMAEALVDRDQYDRPLVLPRSGHKSPCKPRPKGGCYCMVPYTRSSTIGETLSDSFGLNRWQKGNMLKGIGKRPDIVNMARVVRSPSELYELVDLAEALGDNDVAARNGSLMHRLTEDLDHGRDLPDGLPDNITAMLDAYRAEVIERNGLVTLDTEQFVVTDAVKIAGSYDKRCNKLRGEQRGEPHIYIADVKTGQNLDRIALKTCMQVCTYVGSYYDVGTGERRQVPANKDWGLLIWLPWVEKAEDAQCELRWLDLRQGRVAVREALKVRDLRNLKASQLMPRVK